MTPYPTTPSRPSGAPPVAPAIAFTLALLLAAFAGGSEWIHGDDFESGDLSAWDTVTGSPHPCETPLLVESFDDEAEGAPWPPGWFAAGGVQSAAVDAGRATLRPAPSAYSLARMALPLQATDVEVLFSLRFEDVSTQGVGFYVRQNGGYLHDTLPVGAGYAVFVEGFRTTPGIGLWREVAGNEQSIAIHFDASLAFADDTDYRVRFRVRQIDAATTRLQAKVWPLNSPEPFGWQVEADDGTPALQQQSGGLAVDSWSSHQAPTPIAAATSVDDVLVLPLCDPLAGVAPPEAVAETFGFTEGPLWRAGHLLFTDLDASTIERLDPPDDFSTHRPSANEANGLALDVDGALLAAERNPPRISIDDGTVSTLVDSYLGSAFNAPNDLVVRDDGVLYFTDPTYGMVGAPELGFNGLFRRDAGGTLHAEWEGTAGVHQPNGVVLSADGSRLYVSDSATGNVLAWHAGADGALTYLGTLATGLTIPDGMCRGPTDDLWVATWAATLEVYSPDGDHLGSLAVPQAATNCAFGGADGRTLWITAQTGLYRTHLP